MMSDHDWNETAKEFAQHMAQYRVLVKRGAVPFRFLDETTQPGKILDDAPLVIGMFGNADFDAATAGASGSLELDQVRHLLRDEAVEELGFGISNDGFTWALLYGADKGPYETTAGQEFHRELLKSFLEDVAWEAWRSVSALAQGSN
jgi:hypothetical protein